MKKEKANSCNNNQIAKNTWGGGTRDSITLAFSYAKILKIKYRTKLLVKTNS